MHPFQSATELDPQIHTGISESVRKWVKATWNSYKENGTLSFFVKYHNNKHLGGEKSYRESSQNP